MTCVTRIAMQRTRLINFSLLKNIFIWIYVWFEGNHSQHNPLQSLSKLGPNKTVLCVELPKDEEAMVVMYRSALLLLFLPWQNHSYFISTATHLVAHIGTFTRRSVAQKASMCHCEPMRAYFLLFRLGLQGRGSGSAGRSIAGSAPISVRQVRVSLFACMHRPRCLAQRLNYDGLDFYYSLVLIFISLGLASDNNAR
jgi:hypothetical protein